MYSNNDNKSQIFLLHSRYFVHTSIDFFHDGGQIKCSSVVMPISLSSLATKSKFQKNICFKTRTVGLININTKECKGCHQL